MRQNMIQLSKRYLIIVSFFVLLLSHTVSLSQAQSADKQYPITAQWVETFYNQGWQAYENNDWLAVVQNLFLYYQITGGTGAFNNNPQFVKEVSDALQYAQNQIRTALAGNVRSETKAEPGTRYASSVRDNKPTLRRTPPR